jgi:hypothetical protein
MYGRQDAAFLGVPYGLEFKAEGYVAAADVTPGRPVYRVPGTPGSVTPTYGSGRVFAGVAIALQSSHVADVATYKTGESVNVMREGMLWGQVSVAVSTAPAKAYATSAGLFSPTASGNYDVGAWFETNQATVSGLAVIRLDSDPVAV